MRVLSETSGPRPWPGTVRKDVTLGGTLERLVRTAEASGVARGVVLADAPSLACPPAQADPGGAGFPLPCHLCSAVALTEGDTAAASCLLRQGGRRCAERSERGPSGVSRAETLPIPGEAYMQV